MTFIVVYCMCLQKNNLKYFEISIMITLYLNMTYFKQYLSIIEREKFKAN